MRRSRSITRRIRRWLSRCGQRANAIRRVWWQAGDVAEGEAVSRVTSLCPPAEISAVEFEEFVVELLRCTCASVDDLRVSLHDKITGVDGAYDFDATVRFMLGGMNFLVVVEAKKHKNAIKRELVQVLHAKMRSVGAQKAVMIATAPYQQGALEYAKTHGLALATVTEGRYLFETRARGPVPPMTREEARERFGLPDFVARAYRAGEQPGSTQVSLLDTQHPENVAAVLLGADDASPVAFDGADLDAPGKSE